MDNQDKTNLIISYEMFLTSILCNIAFSLFAKLNHRRHNRLHKINGKRKFFNYRVLTEKYEVS